MFYTCYQHHFFSTVSQENFPLKLVQILTYQILANIFILETECEW